MSTQPSAPVDPAAPLDSRDPKAIEFDPRVQIGRSGLKQYGGFIFEEFIQILRGKRGAEAFKEILENSPLVGGIQRLLELTMRQVNKYVEPFSDAPEDEDRAERIDQALDDMSCSWPDFLAEVTTMLPYGFAPMEIVWKACKGWTDGGSPRSRYDDGLIMPRKIYLMAQDTLFRWEFDDEGGVRAMVQLPPPDYQMRTVPIEKMLLFRPHIAKGNPEGNSILRSGYFSWVMIKRLIEFEAISGERDATGIPMAKIPAVNMQAGATPQAQAVYKEFKKLVQNLRIDDQHGCVIPSDVWPDSKQPMFSVELIGLEGRSNHFDFAAAITRHEVRLAMSMLADVMMLGHDKVGSFALSHDKKSMLADALGAWLDAIVAVINRHLFPRIYAYNGWPMDRMCTLGHGGVQADDLEQLSNYVLRLSQAGMPLFPDVDLENHIRAEAGWPQVTEDDRENLGTGEGAEPDVSGPAGEAARPERGASTAKPTPQPGDQAGQKPRGGAKGGRPQKPMTNKERLLKHRHGLRNRTGAYSPRSGDVSTALQLLADRARVGQADDVQHGFLVDQAPYDLKSVTRGAVEQASVQRVQLKDLTATQSTVRRDHVRRFLENPGVVMPGQRNLSGQLEDRPIVVRSAGKDYIHDGHTRLTALSLLGKQDAMVRVVDLDQEDGSANG